MTLENATLANISFSDTKLKIKRGTAAELAAANPTLEAGELAFETDTLVLKAGDGTTAYASLNAVVGSNPAESITLAMMADLARGSIITGQTANNRPTALDAKGSGKILVGSGADLVSVAVSGDATLASTGILTVANPVKRKLAHLTAGLGTRTAVATTGVDLASGSDAVYYNCFCAPASVSIVGMITYLNEEYLKDTTDAVITLKDRTGSPVTKCTYTLPEGGSTAKTMVNTTPTLTGLASGDVLDLYITSTGASGTGYADVYLLYTVDGS